jgi:hypothetical protein
MRMGVDGTGLGSYRLVGFGNSGVERSNSATIVFVSRLVHTEASEDFQLIC